MKIELVDFYRSVGEKKKTKLLGTVHIYLIDSGIDIRGIQVIWKKTGFIFQMPYFKYEDEDGSKGRCPHVSFMKDEDQMAFKEFLEKEVRPLIIKRLRDEKKPKTRKTK